MKDFNRFICNKTKNNNKKHFCECCLQCLSSEKVLIEHKETCLKINVKQSVKLKDGLTGFKNHFRQLTAPFKIYADFECNMKRVQSNDKNNALYTEKYQDQIRCSFVYKVVCIDDKFDKKVVLYRGKNAVYRFIKAILEEYYYRQKVIKKHFNEDLVMPAEDEERFQLSKICRRCDKLIDAGDNKGRDHCYIIGKYRGSAHWSCNINH